MVEHVVQFFHLGKEQVPFAHFTEEYPSLDYRQNFVPSSVVVGSHIDGGGQITGPKAVVDVDDPNAGSARV
jgi:hypothetical protein